MMMTSSDTRTRARLAALSSSAVVDALGKPPAIGHPIVRLSGHGAVSGRARTAICDPGCLSGVEQALRDAGIDDVICIQACTTYAYLGELMAAEAVRRGVGAIVVDGAVRDVERLREMPISVYARGLQPRGAALGGDGCAGTPVRILDLTVRQGDWLIGDDDGVALVGDDRVDACAEAAEAIVARERSWWEQIGAGTSLFELVAAGTTGAPASAPRERP